MVSLNTGPFLRLLRSEVRLRIHPLVQNPKNDDDPSVLGFIDFQIKLMW